MSNKINSRNKGNRFERDVAKWLEKWSGYEFGRVPGSGSLRWKKTDNITGDLCCTNPKHARRFSLSIECKFYQDLKFEHLLLGNKSCKITKFWEQCKGDAIRANKYPMLIMRYNSMPKGQYFIVVPNKLANYIIKSTLYLGNYMIVNTSGETLGIFLSKDLEKVDYLDIHKFIRKHLQK